MYRRQQSHSRIPTRGRMLRWAGWFTFFNAGILMVIISRYFQFAGSLDGSLPLFYAASILVGHSFFLAYGACILILFPIILVWPNRRLVWVLGVLSAVAGIAMLLLDYVVYSQFRVHLNKIMLDLVVGGGRDIFDLSWKNYLVAFLCIVGVLALQVIIAWFVWRVIIKRTRRLKGSGIGIVVGLAFLSAGHIVHAWADATYYRPVTALDRHFPLYYPLTAKRLLQKFGLIDLAKNHAQRKLKINSISDGTIRYPLRPLEFSPVEKSMNVLIIAIDSWRFDMLTPDVTPHIHQFISEHPTWRFNNHLSGGNGTRIGIFSLFYGLPGVHWNAMSNEQIGPVLIREFLNRDYQMGIFASAKLTTPPFNRTVFNDVENLRLTSSGSSAWERDQSALTDWSQWVKKRDPDRPFFGFIFFDAAHTYSIPPDYPVVFKPMWEQVNYLALNKDLDPLPFLNRYKVAVHYIDSLIPQILSDLKHFHLIDNTIIIFTGDHGQEFNDNKRNFWGHGGNYTDYQIKVPLVIYWPGREPGNYDHATSHLDIVPTLMTDLFGCQNPVSDYSDGRHLLDPTGYDWLVVGGYFNYAIREPDRITMAYATGNYEIFDLTNGEVKNARLHYKIIKKVMDRAARFYRNPSPPYSRDSEE
jgi:membrane-anchored protein YejM (alkaline phosphatase superfamily)